MSKLFAVSARSKQSLQSESVKRSQNVQSLMSCVNCNWMRKCRCYHFPSIEGLKHMLAKEKYLDGADSDDEMED